MTRARREINDRWIAAGIFAGALCIRAVGISQPSVWTDEAATIHLVRQPLSEMLRTLLAQDSNPPLSYLVYWGWGNLIDSIAGLRALSAVLGAVATVLVFLLGKRLYDRRAGLFASLLFCVTPLSVALSRQVRYPALLTVFALAATIAWVNLAEKQTAKRALIYAVWMSAALYTHYFSWWIFAAHVVAFYWTRKSRVNSQPLAVAYAAIALGQALWAPVFVDQFLARQGAQLQSEFAYAALLPLVFAYLTQGWTIWRLPEFWQVGPQWSIVLFSMPFAIAIIAGTVVKAGKEISRPLVASLVFIPLLLFMLMSLAMPVFSPQYFLVLLPGMFIAAGNGVTRAKGKVGVVCAMIVLAVPLGGLTEYFADHGTSEPWKEIASLIREEAIHEDRIVVPNEPAMICLSMYDTGVPVIPAFLGENLADQIAPAYGKGTLPPFFEKGAGRVWLIDYYAARFDPDGLIEKELARIGIEIPGRHSFVGDERIRPRLFLTSEMLYHVYMKSEIDFAIPRNPSIDGMYESPEPGKWTAGKSSFSLWVKMNENVCVTGYAPSEFFNGDKIGVMLKVETDVPRAHNRVVALGYERLAGGFEMCEPVGDYQGPVRIILQCDRTFIPDQVRGDGDLREKCLQLTAVGVHP
jgi:mannosyltransferase